MRSEGVATAGTNTIQKQKGNKFFSNSIVNYDDIGTDTIILVLILIMMIKLNI